MANYKQLFMDHMDAEGVKYEEIDERAVSVKYEGDNAKNICIAVIFDVDGDPLVAFKSWDVLSFKGKEAQGLILCNELNRKFRWTKFYLDDDKELRIEADAIVDSETCGEECLSMVRHIVAITDEAYPAIVLARFSGQ